MEDFSRRKSPALPALEQLLREVRADDILVVTRLDRLARSTAELLRVAQVITEKDAGLQSLEEPWADTTTPAGRMVLTMFAGVAEFGRALIRHRTDKGRQAAKRRGVSFGRPQKLPPWSRKVGPSAKSPGRSTSTPQPSTDASTRPKPPIQPYDSTPYRSDAWALYDDQSRTTSGCRTLLGPGPAGYNPVCWPVRAFAGRIGTGVIAVLHIHPNARTTPATRAEIARSCSATIRMSSERRSGW